MLIFITLAAEHSYYRSGLLVVLVVVVVVVLVLVLVMLVVVVIVMLLLLQLLLQVLVLLSLRMVVLPRTQPQQSHGLHLMTPPGLELHAKSKKLSTLAPRRPKRCHVISVMIRTVEAAPIPVGCVQSLLGSRLNETRKGFLMVGRVPIVYRLLQWQQEQQEQQ